MNVTFLPSLQHMALVKVATAMCTYSDFRPLLTDTKVFHELYECKYTIDEKQLRILEDKTMKKLKSCKLPALLQREVVYLLRPMCLQFLRWIVKHAEFMSTEADLHWKSEGTIDEHKTAQYIIQNENIDIQKRFAVACINGLEVDVPRLWNEMLDSEKNSLPPFHLSICWKKWLETRAETDLKLHPCDLYFARDNPERGTNFFFQKLSVDEKEHCMKDMIKYGFFPFSNYRFWIRQMDSNLKEKLFHKHPVWVIKHVLDWPLQSVFFDVADHMWKYLSKRDFYELMVIFWRKIEGGFRDFDYAELLRSYWRKSPTRYREFVKKGYVYGMLKDYLPNN